MKGQKIVIVSVFLLAFSAVGDALAIGFEVDTPLDPFLGGLSKIKRNIVKRIKDLSKDDTFLNTSPGDQLSLFFNQPPVVLPPFVYPDPNSVNAHLPLSQRRLNQIQIPTPQQLNAQFSAFNNQAETNKREAYRNSFFGLRNLPELVQQLTQILPAPINGQLSDLGLRQRYN